MWLTLGLGLRNFAKSSFLKIRLSNFNLVERQLRLIRKMATSGIGEEPMGFMQKLNPTSGKTEWVEQVGDYDYHQEIARAAYADMLHDHDRNMKYYEALKIAIKLKHAEGQEAIVLDIGTGTGLLSMMAVSSGADQVFACEAFNPMAECAAKVLETNKMREKVKLIPKRSTDLLVGDGLDLPVRANILVTEVFDTELIGEGAIQTFNHASKYLLTEDSIIIPTRAYLYAQVVDCSLIPKWNSLTPIRLPNGITVNFPEKISKCSGVPSVHDVQLSEIKPESFTALSEPLPVFQFDWKKPNEFESSSLKFLAKNASPTTAIFSWWDLVMDPLGQNTISCRPTWAGGKDLAWRDHWMQAIYFHPKRLQLEKDKEYSLHSFHDEFSLWFEVTTESTAPSNLSQRPICECGAHLALSRPRLGMWNDDDRNQKFIGALQDALLRKTEACCLVLSEGSPLPFIAAVLGAKKVFVLEPNSFSARVMKELVVFNKMDDRIVIIEKSAGQIKPADFDNLKIDIVVGDPFFQTSVLPWHNLFYWYSIQNLKDFLAPNVTMLPCKGILKGIAVDFKDLWKIKAPVGKPCNGEWDLSDFDDVISKSSSLADCQIDAQPLWEYPGLARSDAFELQQFNFKNEIENIESNASLNGVQDYNGIAFWMEWVLNEKGVTISEGPRCKSVIGANIDWDLNSKQGVYFNWRQQSSSGAIPESDNILKCNSSFNSESGEVNFRFD